MLTVRIIKRVVLVLLYKIISPLPLGALCDDDGEMSVIRVVEIAIVVYEDTQRAVVI